MKHPTNNVFGGFLTIYMVATAWATARPEREQLAFWIGLDLFLQPGARDFRQTTHCTASLAHVLRVVYRTGSFFLGQQQVFPAWLRIACAFGAVLLPLALLIFWMIRVRGSGVYEKISTPRAAHAYPRLGS